MNASKQSRPLWVRGIDSVSTRIVIVPGIVLILMMIQIVVDVAFRNTSDITLPGTLEFTTYWWMPAIVFLALAAAQARNEHLQVTLVTERFPPGARRAALVISLTVTALALICLIWFAWLSGIDAYEINQSAVGNIPIPIWPARLAAALGFAAYLLQVMVSLYRAITEPRELDEAAADKVESSIQ